MYTLKDNQIFSEIENGNNFIYVLESGDYFAGTDYKVLQSQTNEIFIKCMKGLYNGKIALYYMADDYKPISTLIDEVTPETLITIVTNLVLAIAEVRNNGFLSCQNLDISWDKVLVDSSTLKVKLVYLPINVKSFGSYAEFENEFRTGLIKLINESRVSSDDRIEQLLKELADSALTLDTFKAPAEDMNMLRNGSIRIVAMNAPGGFEIVINKDEVVIGKSAELADAVISFNKMISRKHCRISKRNGSYYISDENSANGTYVNRTRIAPGQLHPLRRGDMIRLADSDFQVV